MAHTAGNGTLDDFDFEIDSDLEALVASCQAPNPPPEATAATKRRRRPLTDRPRLRPTKKPASRNAVNNPAEGDIESQLWWQRYEPQTADDLAVHKKRVNEVRDWLLAANGSSRHRVLVLEGPAGAGKSTCVRVLSRDLNLRIVEWENPVDVRQSTASGEGGVGVVRAFGDFLAQAQRYSGPGSRIVLVDDLPNVGHGATRDAFARALTRFAAVPAHESCPLVIIVSDVHAETDADAGAPNDVVPELAQARQTIRFRPVAPTIVERGLKRIVQQRLRLGPRQRLPAEQQALIKRVSSECQGDFRAAVTMLQLEAGAPRRVALDLFHALGKVLHAKRSRLSRINQSQGTLSSINHTQGTLSSLDQSQDRRASIERLPEPASDKTDSPRGVLESSADDVLRLAPVDLSTLRLFVHDSYTDYCAYIHEAAASAAFLSDADMLAPRHSAEPAEWCAASVAVRGHMFARGHPELTTDDEPTPAPPSWHAFRRPQFFDCVRQTAANARVLRSAAPLRVHGLALGHHAVDELALWAPLAARRAGAEPLWRPLAALVAPRTAAEILPMMPTPAEALPVQEKLVLSDDDIEDFSDQQ
ncbi:RFC checkpoint protein Rad17 [Coemansia erecta]|nr:RFC checkpoint protein Rad17 [Coemansia erecta]